MAVPAAASVCAEESESAASTASLAAAASACTSSTWPECCDRASSANCDQSPCTCVHADFSASVPYWTTCTTASDDSDERSLSADAQSAGVVDVAAVEEAAADEPSDEQPASATTRHASPATTGAAAVRMARPCRFRTTSGVIPGG